MAVAEARTIDFNRNTEEASDKQINCWVIKVIEESHQRTSSTAPGSALIGVRVRARELAVMRFCASHAMPQPRNPLGRLSLLT